MGIRCADHVTPLYPQKLALTSPTGGGRSVGIVRSRTKATGVFLIVVLYFLAVSFRRYAIVCKSSSDVAIKMWSSAYSIAFTNFLLFSCIPSIWTYGTELWGCALKSNIAVIQRFYVHGTVHHLSVFNKPTRCSWVVTFISLVDYSTCFGRFLHPSSGVQHLYMQPLAQVQSKVRQCFIRQCKGEWKIMM